jgi:hypothetical protein
LQELLQVVDHRVQSTVLVIGETRIAKVHQQPISEILRNVPGKALDDLGTDGLIDAYHLTVVFWVKLASEDCRVDQVTEHNGELTAFRLRGT